jgi:hypothetical protein
MGSREGSGGAAADFPFMSTVMSNPNNLNNNVWDSRNSFEIMLTNNVGRRKGNTEMGGTRPVHASSSKKKVMNKQ